MRTLKIYVIIVSIVLCSLSTFCCIKNVSFQNEATPAKVIVQKPSAPNLNIPEAPDSSNLTKNINCLIHDKQNVLRLEIADIEIDLSKINKLDEDGEKTGIWIKYSKNKDGSDCDMFISTVSYLAGKKNGIYRLYQKIGDKYVPLILGNYIDDFPVHDWIYSLGEITMIVSKISLNHDFIREAEQMISSADPCACEADSSGDPEYTYQGYQYYYDKNGNLKEEGWLIFENPENCYAIGLDVGEQIQYTTTGEKIIKND